MAIVLRRYDEFSYEEIRGDPQDQRAGDQVAPFPRAGNAAAGPAGLS
ncbi:MAG: hypothetical protein WDO13_00365 [Verrucomicrobiota bacterium]